jgi:hypothetical protein
MVVLLFGMFLRPRLAEKRRGTEYDTGQRPIFAKSGKYGHLRTPVSVVVRKKPTQNRVVLGRPTSVTDWNTPNCDDWLIAASRLKHVDWNESANTAARGRDVFLWAGFTKLDRMKSKQEIHF